MVNKLHNSTVSSLVLNTFAMSNQGLAKAVFKRKAQILTNQSFVGHVVFKPPESQENLEWNVKKKKKRKKIKISYVTLFD